MRSRIAVTGFPAVRVSGLAFHPTFKGRNDAFHPTLPLENLSQTAQPIIQVQSVPGLDRTIQAGIAFHPTLPSHLTRLRLKGVVCGLKWRWI